MEQAISVARGVMDLGVWIGAALKSTAARWRARATRNTLAELDAHTLRDIGVSYSDVMVLVTWGTEGVRKTRHRVVHRCDRC